MCYVPCLYKFLINYSKNICSYRITKFTILWPPWYYLCSIKVLGSFRSQQFWRNLIWNLLSKRQFNWDISSNVLAFLRKLTCKIFHPILKFQFSIISWLLHSMTMVNLNKSEKFLTNTTATSNYIPKRPRICINWNPPFQTSHHKNFKSCFFWSKS